MSWAGHSETAVHAFSNAENEMGFYDAIAMVRVLREGALPGSGPGWMLRAEALKGSSDGVRARIAHGDDPLSVDAGGRTALMGAACNGLASCVAELAPLGGANAVGSDGLTAVGLLFSFAPQSSWAECFAALSPWAEPDGGSCLALALGKMDWPLVDALFEWHWAFAWDDCPHNPRGALEASAACLRALESAAGHPSELRSWLAQRCLAMEERMAVMGKPWLASGGGAFSKSL